MKWISLADGLLTESVSKFYSLFQSLSLSSVWKKNIIFSCNFSIIYNRRWSDAIVIISSCLNSLHIHAIYKFLLQNTTDFWSSLYNVANPFPVKCLIHLVKYITKYLDSGCFSLSHLATIFFIDLMTWNIKVGWCATFWLYLF